MILPDIEVVIQYSIPRDVSTALQRGGHGGCRKTSCAIFLIIFEPWVTEINLSVLNLTVTDPDHPTVVKLSKTSNKKERTGMGMIKIIQSTECLRGAFAQYLGDETPDGESLTSRRTFTHGNAQLYSIQHRGVAIDIQIPISISATSSKVVCFIKMLKLVLCSMVLETNWIESKFFPHKKGSVRAGRSIAHQTNANRWLHGLSFGGTRSMPIIRWHLFYLFPLFSTMQALIPFRNFILIT